MTPESISKFKTSKIRRFAVLSSLKELLRGLSGLGVSGRGLSGLGQSRIGLSGVGLLESGYRHVAG